MGRHGNTERVVDRDDHCTEAAERCAEFCARKLELPVYSGTDPYEWANRADRYFNSQQLSPAEQLDVVVLFLEGATLSWFHWENQHRPI